MKPNITKIIFALFLSGTSGATFAQSQLEVRCLDDLNWENGYSINGQIMEYGVSGSAPSFYVAVIDQSDCSVWGTDFDGANPDHAFGNYNGDVSRVQHYFAFQQNDSLQLAGMLNMLQQIPNGSSIIIYTPNYYDYATVNAANPNLTQALTARWGTVVEGNSMMVLYGEKGNAGSYVSNASQVDGKILFTQTVCNTALGTEEHTIENPVLKTEGNTVYLDQSLSIDEIMVVDAMGRQLPFVRNENTLTLDQSANSGMYLFQFVSGKKTYHAKLLMAF